jgi:hypothetical protein
MGRTVLSPVYERREICIAYGGEAHMNQLPPEFVLENHLSSILGNYPNVERVSEHEYRNHRQRVIFLIRHTTNKNDFRKWLQTPGLHVIYNGHARNGRGPCFGRIEAHGRGEVWAEGTDRQANGMFRMGFPYIGAAATEITSHGYTARLLRADEAVPAEADCHPEVVPYLSRLQAKTPEELGEGLVGLVGGHRAGDRYWCYQKPAGGPWFVIHHAGWQETASSPYDWGGTEVACRVFCHFGCSTFIHNYPVMRRLAGWRREGNDRYAYWTTGPAVGVTYSRWVANLITYDQENANASWEGSLESALRRTNQDLRSGGFGYRLR